MTRSASIKTSFFIYLFSMFLMVAFFSQSFSECIQHSITKTVVRQQIVSFRPFIETSDSQNTRYFRMLVQIHERRLDKCLKGSWVLILKDSTCRPLTAIRLLRTTGSSSGLGLYTEIYCSCQSSGEAESQSMACMYYL